MTVYFNPAFLKTLTPCQFVAAVAIAGNRLKKKHDVRWEADYNLTDFVVIKNATTETGEIVEVLKEELVWIERVCK
jgi:hypothetical protein